MNQPQSKWSRRCMLQANESTSSQYFLHRIWINLVIIIYQLITKKPENKNKMQLINREVEFYQWCWACDDQKPRIEWPSHLLLFSAIQINVYRELEWKRLEWEWRRAPTLLFIDKDNGVEVSASAFLWPLDLVFTLLEHW